MERADPAGIRFDAEKAGIDWPKVPPKPGVEVTETTSRSEVLDVMRIAPKSFVSSKTEPRTSRNVVDAPASRSNVFSGPVDPSRSCPRNLRVKDAFAPLPFETKTDRKSTRLNSSHLGISY